jgi:short subunit dehydrogenase-like uncharacterized protein
MLSATPPLLACTQERMARRSRVVISAAGPFRFLGEPVVEACIRAGAHYLDISGEPEFIEAVELRHGRAAEAAGVTCVSSCGVDSVPADVGLLYCAERMREAGFLPTAAESFVALQGGRHVSSGRLRRRGSGPSFGGTGARLVPPATT